MRVVGTSSQVLCAAAFASVLLWNGLGCTRPAAEDKRADDEQAIRKLDEQWSKTAGAKDLNGTLSFYADNAVLLPPDESVATGADARRKSWAGTLIALDSIQWHINTIEVARSGDLAYVTGAWQATAKMPNGQTVPQSGKLLEVWRKEADGQWKCAADTYNSDAPSVTPTNSSQ